MSNHWQKELDLYLLQTELDIKNCLVPIKSSLEHNGIPFDEKFKNHFLQIIKNRLIEVYSRFEIQSVELPVPNKRKRSRDADFSDEDNWNISGTSPHSSKATELEMHEWAEQKRLLNRIIVHGLPKIEERENLRSIFLRLCRCLKVDISNNDIISISRKTKSSKILVELRKFHIKEEIRTAPLLKNVTTADIYELPPNIRSTDVFINHDTTPYYLEMDIICRQALRKGSLYSYHMTAQGFFVQRNSRSKAEKILSIQTLFAYIAGNNESKYGKKKQKIH